MLQGIPPNDSDVEWDEDIQNTFGRRWRNTVWEDGGELDAGLDMADMLQHAFHHYDTEIQFDGRNFVNQGTPVHEEDHSRAPIEIDPLNNPPGVDENGASSSNLEEDEVRVDEGEEADAVNEPNDLSDDEDGNPLTLQEELLQDSINMRLFPGSSLSSLSTTLLLLMSCHTHGCSTAFIDELFKLLSKSILPTANSLPTSEYLASKKLKELGLSYNSIHACQNGCLLFRGEYEADTHCTKCGTARYRQVGKSWVPVKVLRHFPLIPRIQRMFSTPLQASYMTWHKHYANQPKNNGMMRCVADSPQWNQINEDSPEFAVEPRNIRFAVATDGVNPFSVKRSTWSTWPVMLLNYNIPPWLITKKHFIILSLIIPGKKSVTGENFDVYMKPLLEEFQYGWSMGIRVQDAANYMGSSLFKCRFMCIFTIGDYPALGIVSGMGTKGYQGCVCCGPATISRRSCAMKKNTYGDQHRLWLPADHSFRFNRAAFYSGVETRSAPTRPTDQVVEIANNGEKKEKSG